MHLHFGHSIKKVYHVLVFRLFTGEVWTGKDAIDLGLADSIGHVDGFIREEYGGTNNINVKRFKQGGGSLLERFQSTLDDAQHCGAPSPIDMSLQHALLYESSFHPFIGSSTKLPFK